MSALGGVIPQLEVLQALVLRETRTRFGKSQLGYLWAFIEPLLWILTFQVMFQVAGREAPYGMSIAAFIATGMVPYQIFRETLSRTSNAVDGNKALLFYPQVRPLDLVLARTVLEAVTLTTVLATILGVHGLLTEQLQIDDPLAMLIGISLMTLLGSSLGLVVGSLSIFNDAVARIVPPLLRPMLWISGLFFTANGLPSQVRDIMLWNPVLHAVELVRAGYFETYEATYASYSYLGIWIAITMCAGLLLERMARRRLEVT